VPAYPAFLPVSRDDLESRGWDGVDFVFVSGDAYVDHPSFAAAVIGRVLEAEGYRVGIIAQPEPDDPNAYAVLGRPRLAFLVGAGNIDSMVARYTAGKKPRSEDAYSPGGRAGPRPDRAVLRYVAGLRAAFKDVPVIVGGVEAGLRRFAHYDYWTDTVRRSLLLDSKADLLVYGMGERPIRGVAARLAAGEPIESIRDLPGTCWRCHGEPPLAPGSFLRLPDFAAVKGADPASKRAFADHFRLQKRQADPLAGQILAEKTDERWVVQNPPALPLDTPELDAVYELPYTRRAHPMYDAAGGVPALSEVQFSLVSSRGCFGGCSFCSITFHQGRAVRGRSRASLVREAAALTRLEGFKGYIHDVGGPTANFRGPACAVQAKGGACLDRDCLYPEPCPRLRADHREYVETLRAIRAVPGVKKVFIRSGIRFDYLLLDEANGDAFLEELCRHHIGGQLKVAPEHVAPAVLAAMGKTGAAVYAEFRRRYEAANRRLGLKQYLVPYFIAGHPGAGLDEAVQLAEHLKSTGFVPDQAQDFYPTPGTLATAMYRTGLDPRTMESVHVASGDHERRLQRALLQFNKPENRPLVLEALRAAGREDLIGRGPDCLVGGAPAGGPRSDPAGRPRSGPAPARRGPPRPRR
jgi:uncharacterized radical SAM protein YgiQ